MIRRTALVVAAALALAVVGACTLAGWLIGDALASARMPDVPTGRRPA